MNIQNKSVKNKVLSIILLFGVILGMIVVPATVCEASSATITLSTDKSSVVIGDEVLVTIQLSSKATMGDFEAYISYDPGMLEFKSDADFIAGGDGTIKISDVNVVNGEYSRKYIIKFIAKEVGNCDIELNKKATLYDFESGQDMSVSSNKININVSASKSASKNANLKSLKVSPGTLTPAFDPSVSNYTIDVTNETKQLVISAVTQNDKATVAITGNDKLKPGPNNIVIVVKAESGHKKEYTINAVYSANTQSETLDTAETKEEQTANSVDSNQTEIDNLQVIKDGDKTYIQNGFRYQIIPVGDVKIPDGYIKTSIIIDDVTVDAYTPENDLESEFLLLYAQNNNGEKGFYQYDRIEKTIQRYITKNADSSNKVIMSDKIIRSEEYKSKITTMAIVIAVLGAIIITMSIVLIHTYLKSKEAE